MPGPSMGPAPIPGRLAAHRWCGQPVFCHRLAGPCAPARAARPGKEQPPCPALQSCNPTAGRRAPGHQGRARPARPGPAIVPARPAALNTIANPGLAALCYPHTPAGAAAACCPCGPGAGRQKLAPAMCLACRCGLGTMRKNGRLRRSLFKERYLFWCMARALRRQARTSRGMRACGHAGVWACGCAGARAASGCAGRSAVFDRRGRRLSCPGGFARHGWRRGFWRLSRRRACRCRGPA